MAARSLELSGLSASYGKQAVLHGLDLDLAPGELVSLLGPSGCGKTTTLRIVAGFLRQTQGEVRVDGRPIDRLPPHRRDIGIVFQTYALFPHMSVLANVAFGLKQRGVEERQRGASALAMLERVGLADYAERLPAALSGGQRQRVALARAMVISPSLLLFDEPLSNLDARLRVEMRAEIRGLQQQAGTTTLYVTHDQEEAFSISDRVALMSGGRIAQLGTPQSLYHRPASRFVARFVGFESLIEGEGPPIIGGQPAGSGPTLAVRPEGLRLADASPFKARVELRTYLGRAWRYRMASPAGPLMVDGPAETPLEPGTETGLEALASHACRLPD